MTMGLLMIDNLGSYISSMKLRLIKEGPESLKEYLRVRYTLSHLAERMGISNQNIHPWAFG